jgi:hypothetical protein
MREHFLDVESQVDRRLGTFYFPPPVPELLLDVTFSREKATHRCKHEIAARPVQIFLRRKIMLRKLNLLVALLAVVLAICAAKRLTTVRAQTEVHPTEGACCGKKPPKFPDLKATTTTAAQTYSTFTGQVAIVTGQLRGGSSVIAVDLKNENTGLSVNTNIPEPTYQHPDWLTTKIGDVFGLTLDSRGDVFVTATTSYLIKAAVTTANPGKIYRIDGTTGLVNTFATLPNNVSGPALGNIHYSCVKDSYYVSNFADGRIYQITKSTPASPTGNIVANYDHQTGTIVLGANSGNQETNTNYSNFVPKNTVGVARGGRVWGLAVFRDRLYYGVWRQDTGENSALNNDNHANEVWSIGLLGNGNFTGVPTLEITLPTLQSTNPLGGAKTFSNPVSSITFSAAGNMLLAERTMNGDRNNKNGNYAAHASRYLEYTKIGPSWTLLFPTQFGPGTLTSSGQPSSAGGATYDSFGARVWGTADAMQLGPQILYGIQGIPMGGGNVASSLLVDLTDSTTTYDKNQMGDVEIPCSDCSPTPTPSPAECCDKLTAVPHPQPNVSLDYRTFTITNLKAPQSPICSIDISMNPTPSPGWQGGDLVIDNLAIPTATRFIYPYTRIPNKGTTTISAMNTVVFNLGVDYTLGWTGTVTFVVHHCDGSICTLSYGPWSALPPTPTPGTSVFDANVIQEGKLYTIGLQLKQRDMRVPVKWIGFTVGDESGQIFAASAPPVREARGRNFAEAILENSGLTRSSVLYTFAQELKSGTSSNFNLVVRRDSNAADRPLVRFTTYDANGNALETGTIGAIAPK